MTNPRDEPLTRRQPFDAGRIDARERVFDLHACNNAIGRDLSKRHQHEGALQHVWVRQNQARLGERYVIVGENVDVDDARSPVLLAGAVEAELMFAVQRPYQLHTWRVAPGTPDG